MSERSRALKRITLLQKLLRRLGLVRYRDFMRCRDALDEVAIGLNSYSYKTARIMSALRDATIICDYPDVVLNHYPDYD